MHFDLAALFRISGHSEDTFGMVALAQQQFVLLRQSFVARRTICEEQRAETTRIFGLHLLEGICFFNAKLALWRRFAKRLCISLLSSHASCSQMTPYIQVSEDPLAKLAGKALNSCCTSRGNLRKSLVLYGKLHRHFLNPEGVFSFTAVQKSLTVPFHYRESFTTSGVKERFRCSGHPPNLNARCPG